MKVIYSLQIEKDGHAQHARLLDQFRHLQEQTLYFSSKPSVADPLTKVLSQRNAAIDCIYSAQNLLSLSRSSLFLGTALIDKLLFYVIHSMSSIMSSLAELLISSLANLIRFILSLWVFYRLFPIKPLIWKTDYIETQSHFWRLWDTASLEEPIFENLDGLEHKLGKNLEQSFELTYEILLLLLNSAKQFSLVPLNQGPTVAWHKEKAKVSWQNRVLTWKLNFNGSVLARQQ